MLETPFDVFRDELNPGERMIWNGQPQQGFLLRPSDALLIPFSLLWGGSAIFWEANVVLSGAPFSFMLAGIPFVLIGLYLIFGRFFVDMTQRRKTYYALTNERVMIISGMFKRNIKSLDLKQLPEINITTRNDGKGTITFGPSYPMGWMSSVGGFSNAGSYPVAPGFEMIEDAKRVYQQIKRLQRGEG